MGFSCGIIGLPNSGKSTIFNALTALCVAAQPVSVLHHRAEHRDRSRARRPALASGRDDRPEKVTPTTIEFIDIAGLVKDAHKGEGLGNRFLGQIREVDAVAHVVRCFEGNNVPHVYSTIDPKRDMETIETEIIIADLDIVEERLARLEHAAKVSREKHEEERNVLLKVKTQLEAGRLIDAGMLAPEERDILRSFSLITAKPVFYIANVDENDLARLPLAPVEGAAAERGRPVVYICGKLEEELAVLPAGERADFMEMYGMTEVGIEKIIKVGYGILGLITFYTVVGKEMRAWTVRRNTAVVKAAGRIHTDMERGFIKAEVIPFDEFVKVGSEHAAREKGVLKIEGKEYIVQDGDILRIRFNV